MCGAPSPPPPPKPDPAVLAAQRAARQREQQMREEEKARRLEESVAFQSGGYGSRSLVYGRRGMLNGSMSGGRSLISSGQ